MDLKKKIRTFLFLLLIIGTSVLLPAVIEGAVALVLERMAYPVEETNKKEMEPEKIQVSVKGKGGEEIEEERKPFKTKETEKERSSLKAEELDASAWGKDLKIIETNPGEKQIFLPDGEALFIDALSDYLTSSYGEGLSIQTITLKEKQSTKEELLTYLVEVAAEKNERIYRESFLVTYEEEMGFYSIYPYQDMTA